VEDVSDNKEYFDKDIDLIAVSGNEKLLVEVKSDSRMNNTGNAVIELVSNYATGRKGWFYTT
jgi:peptidyl-tRNA hydrolase